MHLWQGTNIRKLKYQNENINKPGPKMKALTIGDFNGFSWYVFNQFK